MIKRPKPEHAEKNPGFLGTLFAFSKDGPPTPLAKPSQADKYEGSGPDGVELTVKGANKKGDNEDDGLMASARGDKSKLPTRLRSRLHSLSIVKHGAATDWDKFIAYRDLLLTLWYRKIKYSSGAFGVAATSYVANLLMLILCLFVRQQVSFVSVVRLCFGRPIPLPQPAALPPPDTGTCRGVGECIRGPTAL